MDINTNILFSLEKLGMNNKQINYRDCILCANVLPYVHVPT